VNGLDFSDLSGRVSIERAGWEVWVAEVSSGEENMSHTLENLEHHHFKYSQHRIPGDVHYHFLGADRLSFRDHCRLQNGDLMKVHWKDLGRPLQNPLIVEDRSETLLRVGEL
jgi:hypothetical protein